MVSEIGLLVQYIKLCIKETKTVQSPLTFLKLVKTVWKCCQFSKGDQGAKYNIEKTIINVLNKKLYGVINVNGVTKIMKSTGMRIAGPSSTFQLNGAQTKCFFFSQAWQFPRHKQGLLWSMASY